MRMVGNRTRLFIAMVPIVRLLFIKSLCSVAINLLSLLLSYFRCYGIVEVPEGEWYCAKCTDFIAHSQYNGNSGDVGEVRETPRCKLCPFGHGALKRTDNDEWAHVICALYIPEVRFGDVHSMDPVILSDVPLERFQQQCYLCMERGEEKRAYLGACMPCNKPGCKKCFHVTCAQAEGLLCEEGGGSKNVKYCGYCTAHAKKAVSLFLVSSFIFSNYLLNNCDSKGIFIFIYFISQELLQNTSLAYGGNYGGIKLATTTSSSITATSFTSNLRTEGPTMLVDPLYRTSLPPPTVDRAMLNAVMSQSLAVHSMHDDICSPPMSSGRSSTAHSTPPPVTAAISLKKDQSIYELPSSSNATVPLPTNVALLGVQKNEVLSTGITEEKDLSNGSLISQLEIKLQSRTNYLPTDNGSVASIGSKTVKRKAADGAEKPKRPRNNKACKSMKALLESVGPLISETVSDFQRERLNERDNNMTITTTTHSAVPSTSAENEITTCTVSASTSAVQCTVVTCSSTSTQQQQSTTPTVTTTSTFVGVPLIRTQPKAIISQDAGVAVVAVDRTHVTSSLPSTSGAVAATSVCPISQQSVAFPQSMEELLERQWEQGSHFLMSHAPFDIAQLLSCLHELKMENVRLEETLSQLARRRDHLLALNTRLSLSLASGSSLGLGTSPHHSPRISAAGSSGNIPLASTSSSMQSNNGISSTQCTTQPTSSASISSLPSIVPLPPTTICGQQQQQSLQAAAGSAVISFLNPFCSTLPPVIDDSLNQLRSLASNGSVITNRSGQTPQAAVAAAAAAAAVAAAGQLAGTAGSENRQTPVASTNSSTTSMHQASLPSSRIPSAASANAGIGTPLLANFSNAQLATSLPSTATVTNALDLFGGSQNNAHLTLTPERQQMAAAAIAAAAAANALGGNFVAPRTPTHSSAAVSGTSAIGQLASTELLAQYALLAQQQLLHQQAAVAALSARYGSQVISSSSTSPHSTSSNSQLSSNPHSGK
ncbi:hypothetical protein X798_06723 [Onchocerca flexuosa]|uniref:PHD-type domain-containing protein n=2 Tax=Onchocerca flexuosa TaxID=387005 RepID=A0A238BLF5_9BILA|nr:hypothetical protein X798_06723 [Onchocerca flexuosa]